MWLMATISFRAIHVLSASVSKLSGSNAHFYIMWLIPQKQARNILIDYIIQWFSYTLKVTPSKKLN